MSKGALFVCAETFLTTFSFGLFFFLLLYTPAIERKTLTISTDFSSFVYQNTYNINIK